MGPAEQVLSDPQHPYTRNLLAAAPSRHTRVLDADQSAVSDSEPADPHHPPAGCRYHTHCPIGPLVHPERSLCTTADPSSAAGDRRHHAACHFAATA